MNRTTILAAAGLNRLGLQDHITQYFTPEEMTPAPGQGTLAIQMRTNSTQIAKLVAQINDGGTAHCAQIERSFSHAVGGGCKSPTGAYAYRDGSDCILLTMYAEASGVILRHTHSAAWDTSTDLGLKAARQYLQSS